MSRKSHVGSVNRTIHNGIFYVQWKIEGLFFHVPHKNLSWESSQFKMWEETWDFTLSQIGWRPGPPSREQSLELALICRTCDEIQPATFTSGIKREDGTVYKSSESQTVTRGFFALLPVKRSELELDRNEIAPNGNITFFVTGFLQNNTRSERTSNILQIVSNKDIESVIKEKVELFDSNDVAVLTESLKNLYLNEQNCDVTIMVGENEFKAHKAILAARSTVFASMFEHDMKESRSGIINIPDCDPTAFRNFLLYVYTAKIENFCEEDVLALHFIADKYDVKQLALQCLKFMMSNISVESFCDILTLAVKYNESELITKAEQFFAKNLQGILPTVQWKSFLKENPTVANELFIKTAKRFN